MRTATKVHVKGPPHSVIQSELCSFESIKGGERGYWKKKTGFPHLNLTGHLCEDLL